MERQSRKCSAKTGEGVLELLNAIVKSGLPPPPEGDPEKPLEALIFDANYDPYRGTVISVRIVNGTVKTW